MLRLGVTSSCAALPQPVATLWHCYQCNAFVSILSAKVVDEAFCPVCGDVALDFCGDCSGIAGVQFADA